MPWRVCQDMPEAQEAEEAEKDFGITQIGEWMFDRCSSLTEEGFVLLSTVEKIGFGAFQNCEKITKLTIPEGVESIDRAAFQGCANLKEVALPRSLTDISVGAFWGLKDIIFMVPAGSYAAEYMIELGFDVQGIK